MTQKIKLMTDDEIEEFCNTETASFCSLIDECEKRAFEKVKEQIERFHLWFLNRELAVRHLPKGKFEQLFQQYLKEQNGKE